MKKRSNDNLSETLPAKRRPEHLLFQENSDSSSSKPSDDNTPSHRSLHDYDGDREIYGDKIESEQRNNNRERDEEQLATDKSTLEKIAEQEPTEVIKKQCLKSKKPRMRVNETFQTFSFTFNWVYDKKFRDVDVILQNPNKAPTLSQRGCHAGMD